MTARFRDWWSARAPRERWLLGIMAVLAGVVLFWLLIVRPLGAARMAAEQRLATATSDAGRVAAAADAMRIARRTAPPALGVALTAAIQQAAETSGFTLSRLEPMGTDRATIGISSARAPALFAWLVALERQGIIVERQTLRANSDGTLAVEGVLRLRAR